ncbi:Vacuolar sorting-associated vps5 [Hyphodiscus hymeniophilus]|uniref:Vacuolar sorting-associated vps5 n=1 Tax=Hyphodiscus hymeniophilus TaxID=353542 RepID=A0A9P6VFA5_9HELO|nr:Vacuolar sorting-associated vps5 [Hyphodiscus hymeniophilus]
MDLEDGGDSPWGDVPSRSPTNTAKPTEATVFGERGRSISELVRSLLMCANKAEENGKTPTLDTSIEPSSSQTLKSPAGRQRGPRRAGAQPVRLQAVDDSLGPLGPLGDNAPAVTNDVPPIPPQKEQLVSRQTAGSKHGSQPADVTRKVMDSGSAPDDMEPTVGPRIPPPVQPSQGAQVRRETQPSVSIEQAAKPSFDISVGDPHKVGDLTSSHIVYLVKTKTTSKAYRQPEFAVTRRYRDFLWLYNSLHSNNPGVVVPPPPEKQAVGRFDTNFVESRRAALERMLNKTAAHPTLQHDGDLKLFLESEAFNVDVKHKERKEPGLGESKGMFSGLSISVGGGSKFVEQDEWFHERRVYLDALENQLKSLLKAMDVVVSQRKGIAEAAGDFSASLHSLSTVELSASLSGPLEGLADLQIRIKELYDRQAQQDVLTLGITIDEYIRLIGSIKNAFGQRQKAYHSWHTAESEMQKRKSTQDKLLRQGKTQQDRLTQMHADVADAERKVHQARLLFEDMGRLMRGELERFETEKVEDFKSAVETFLEGAVEAQKELIELWETFLMQLDAEENDNAFYKPPVEPAARGAAKRLSGEMATDSKLAATVTAEDSDDE